MVPTLSREMTLLLACARVEIDRAAQDQILHLAQRKLSWGRLVYLARQHRVIPLLYRAVHTVCPGLVPQEILEALRRDYQANAARNMFLAEELIKILDLFAAHGIEAIPFKGPVLAERYYGCLGFRQFDDLDVLIRERDVLKARDLLFLHGYTPGFDCIREGDPHYLREAGEYSFFSHKGAYQLEIHWQPVTRAFLPHFNLEALWRRSKRKDFRGRRVRQLSDEDALFVHTVHGTQHLWGRLIWLYDWKKIHQALTQRGWRRSRELALESGAGRMLRIAALLLASLYGESTSGRFLEEAQADRAARKLSAQFCHGLISQRFDSIGGYGLHLLHARTRSSVVDRIRYLTNLIVRPSLLDWSLMRLPRSMHFIYGILRPWRKLFNLGVEVDASVRTAGLGDHVAYAKIEAREPGDGAGPLNFSRSQDPSPSQQT